MTSGVWASSPTRAFGTGYGARLQAWNGTTWFNQSVSGNSPTFGVWGYGNNLVVVGQNGESTLVAGANTALPGLGFYEMRAVHGLDDGGSIYAAGSNLKIFSLVNGTWQPVFDGGADVSTTPTFRGLWVVAPNDVYASALSGGFVHFNGSTWSPVALPGVTTQHLFRIWAGGANDVWVVGTGGLVRHWNGTIWESLNYPGLNDLRGVWGTGTGDVWIAGAGGTLAHYENDGGWATINTGTSMDLLALWGGGPFDLFTVPLYLPDGGNGTLHYKR